MNALDNQSELGFLLDSFEPETPWQDWPGHSEVPEDDL